MSEYGIYFPEGDNPDNIGLLPLPADDNISAMNHFMQEHVNGYFEICSPAPQLVLPRRAVMVLNDEGKLEHSGCAYNQCASWIYNNGCYGRPYYDPIFGPVLLLNTRMTPDGPTCCGWPKETAKQLLNAIQFEIAVTEMIYNE